MSAKCSFMYMVLNQGKCQFMCLGRNTENKTFVLKKIIMKITAEQKIIAIIIYNKLKFKGLAKYLCKKASQKI